MSTQVKSFFNRSKKNGAPSSKKAGRRIEDSTLQNMQMDHNGNILFSPIRTINHLPAGEYLPVLNNNREGVLTPLNRSKLTSLDRIITNEPTITVDPDDFISDLDLVLSEMTASDLEQREQKHFIPAHKYFPMEKYNKGLKMAKDNINRFINGREIYQQLQLDYRRGILLYGEPGVGKSQFIYRLSQELIEDREAIVVRVEDRRSMEVFYENIMNSFSLLTDRLKVIVIEELADLCAGSSTISMLLNVLDSMVLRENVVFLITTNYPNRIPANIVDRPSRLDLLCPIYNKDFDSDFLDEWYKFCLNRSITEEEKAQPWYKETIGKLSPAYFKEMFIYSVLHEITIEEAWQLIKNRKAEINNDFDQYHRDIGFI